MPREITILSSAPHDLYAVADAAEGIGSADSVRQIEGGAGVQVVDRSGRDLLTVYAPRLLSTPGEVERLLPAAPEVSLPTYWCDAFAPLDDDGEAGVSIALRLALALGAVCVVED
ncbi:hypothetical protein [Frondihabitans australicus]|uniref:Uncharacterized protein n=1 Tax=Frondihabitans australicus TaxID=386892 RepID=A0A495ICJ5_9MICO|nr:hypothetical protein [Frondihabitans australicus]RKR73188.1 hypothetical protein C8E83_0278 [Frondihabitans australicus]